VYEFGTSAVAGKNQMAGRRAKHMGRFFRGADVNASLDRRREGDRATADRNRIPSDKGNK
jgi:hypothetical protein